MRLKDTILGSRLHTKILLMMVFVGIVPIATSGLLAFYSVNFSHGLSVATIEESLLYGKAEEIRRFFQSVTDILELQVGFDQIGDIELPSQHFLLSQMLAANQAFVSASFINLSGEETSRAHAFYKAGVLELRKMGLSPHFIAAKAGNAYLGPVYYTEKGPMITAAAPVKNKNGIIISVLSGEISLSAMQAIMKDTKLGNAGYLYLTDKDGFMVAKSAGETSEESLSRAPGVSDVLSGKLLLGYENQQRYRSFFGEEVIASGVYLPAGFALLAEWPIADADSILMTLRNQIVAFSLVVFGVTILLSVFLAGQIVNPVKALEAGAKLVAEGKFDHRVAIQTGDEMEDLGRAFNDMAAGLKQLQQLKDEFVFIAAHELKTPVAATKGYLSLILEGSAGRVDATAKEFIHKVLTANARLIRLVEDLLEVARSEAGRLQIEVAPINPATPIAETLSELKPLADEKRIAFSYEPGSLPQVLADAARLREVLVNLVGNAVKYSPPGASIRVSHEIRDGRLWTRITDNGFGISKEAQKKLFEKFYRVQTEKTKTITGTGLGLFIVKQIVEKMNGEIGVESEEGKGSTFRFSLPLADA